MNLVARLPYGKLWILLIVVAALAASAPGARAAELTLELRDRDIRGVAVLVDGQLFADYHIDLGAKPILWPLIGPAGHEMTRRYPMIYTVDEKRDHPHQRSLWFTHGDVNGIDFWSEVPGRHGSIVHRQYLRTEAAGDHAVISTVNDWLGPDGTKQLEDQRTLTFRAGSDWRSIDFDIELRATAGPVVFGNTKEGTFGIRLPTTMDVDTKLGGRIVNSEGDTDKDAWGKRAAWVDYHGPVVGADGLSTTLGVAVLNHPSSFRYPTHWHVRTYGLFAANPFGAGDFEPKTGADGRYELPAGESIRLRYRVLLHTGDDKTGAVAEAYAAYADEK
jgi:hypothetical protein